jgi:hypothetical protein
MMPVPVKQSKFSPMKATLLTVAMLALVAPVASQTADEIVAKNLAARGGLEKLRAIRTMVLTGRISLGPDAEGPITVRLVRPVSIREDFTIQGSAGARAYDGHTGWQIVPGSGKGPQPLSGPDLANLQDEALNGIDGPLADYAAKGNRVEFLGTADVEGQRCYRLKVTLKTGRVMYQYLDAQSFLEVREEIERTLNGKLVTLEEEVGDYRETGGILFAHSFVSGLKGNPLRSRLSIEKIELNPAIDPAVFQMPKPPAAKP